MEMFELVQTVYYYCPLVVLKNTINKTQCGLHCAAVSTVAHNNVKYIVTKTLRVFLLFWSLKDTYVMKLERELRTGSTNFVCTARSNLYLEPMRINWFGSPSKSINVSLDTRPRLQVHFMFTTMSSLSINFWNSSDSSFLLRGLLYLPAIQLTC